MYIYSNDFRRKLDADQRNFTIRIHMTVSDIDGNIVEFKDDTAITNENMWETSFSVNSATSNTDELTIGAVVASELKFSLCNDDNKYSEVDFVDGSIILWIGMDMDDGTREENLYGTYTITDAHFSNASIDIVALDNICKLSHEYEGGIMFPATLDNIVRVCCNACGVMYDTSLPAFMLTHTVPSAPQDTSLTYAGLLSYCAQMAGCFVRCTPDGRIRYDWYSMATLNDNADGGTFKYDGWTDHHLPESQLDGGTFKYNDGDNYDGGSFRDLATYHTINYTSTSEFATDDIAITGVKVTSMPVDSSIEADTTLVGTEGYVIEINSNPLIQEGQSGVVATQIYEAVKYMIFRPLSVSTLPDPSIEAGDIGQVADINGNYYRCFFSNVTFSTDSYMQLSCDAPSRNRQNANVQSALSAVLQKSKEWTANEKSAREIALENLTNLMSNSLGFYSSEVAQQGGGSILYLHNKKTLAESNIQWKVTSDGVAVSTDYGRTFNSGWTKDGNMVANTLSAVGVNADWINAGTITGRKINNGNGTFLVDELGNVTANSLSSNNANITGGTININSSSSTADLIQLTYGSKATQISPVHFQISEGGESVTVTDESIIVNKTGGGGTSAIYHNKIMENNQYLSDKYTSTATYNAGINGVYETFSAYSEAINAKATKSSINGTYTIKADNAAKTTLATIKVTGGVITSISTNG